MSDRISSADLEELYNQLADLTQRVLVLEDRVTDLGTGAVPVPAPVTVNYSFGGPATSPYPAGGDPVAARVDHTGAASTSTSGTPVTRETASSYSDEFRSRVAREAGAFIRRCLDGQHRGESGRDRLRLQSRIYLIFQDFQGRRYDPVRICHSFAEARPLVKPDGYLGESILLGWPTQWEARLCCREAGIAWPSDAGRA